jgi:hypothetical protein
MRRASVRHKSTEPARLHLMPSLQCPSAHLKVLCDDIQGCLHQVVRESDHVIDARQRRWWDGLCPQLLGSQLLQRRCVGEIAKAVISRSGGGAWDGRQHQLYHGRRRQQATRNGWLMMHMHRPQRVFICSGAMPRACQSRRSEPKGVSKKHRQARLGGQWVRRCRGRRSHLAPVRGAQQL